MIVTHEHDCDFQVVGVCTCGAFLKCSRLSGTAPGMVEHDANLKKLRALLEGEKATASVASPVAADRVQDDESSSSAGGGTGATV